MFIKFKFLDTKMPSCVVPLQSGTSSFLKVKDGTKLEVTAIQFADLIKACEGSTKVAIQEIEAKEFKELKEVPKEIPKEQAKEAK